MARNPCRSLPLEQGLRRRPRLMRAA